MPPLLVLPLVDWPPVPVLAPIPEDVELEADPEDEPLPPAPVRTDVPPGGAVTASSPEQANVAAEQANKRLATCKACFIIR